MKNLFLFLFGVLCISTPFIQMWLKYGVINEEASTAFAMDTPHSARLQYLVTVLFGFFLVLVSCIITV